MSSWNEAVQEGLVAGSLASIVSAAALAAAGQRENGSAAAPANATSHWLWKERAFEQDAASVRYTVTGYLIHHAASVFWATLHARLWGMRREAKAPLPALAGATVAAALAWFVDYRMTPQRLTPGFEHRLSRGSMATAYACFALGLAAGSVLAGRRR